MADIKQDDDLNNITLPEHDDADLGEGGYADFLDESAFSRAGGSILRYDGVSYASGLVWLTVGEDYDKSAIYKKCKSLKADFYCYRNSIFQCGFGRLSDGHRISMVSMAAMAADSLVGEWHGVFVADNGWHYVAVHSDTIAPFGDILFDDEEAAYNHFIVESKKIKWPKTYVPDSWNYDGSDGEISYDSILENMSATSLKPANLDALFSGKINKGMAIIGVLFLLLVVFFSVFSNSLISGMMPQKIEASFSDIGTANTIAIPPREVAKKTDAMVEVVENFSIPKPSDVIEACMSNFDDIMVPLPGWNLNLMRCRSNIVEGMWRKGVGSLATIQPYIDQFPFGVNPIFGSRNDFLVSKAINSNALTSQKMKLAKRQDILLTLNNRFVNLGRMEVQDIAPAYIKTNRAAGGSRRLKAKTRKSKSDKSEEKRTMEDLPSLSITLNTKTAPVFIKEYFDIPGLKINFVEWNVNNSSWTFNMRVYLLPANFKGKD